MKYLSLLFVVLLIGCASEKELKMGYDAQVNSAEIQAVIMREQPPTFSIDCTEGCGNAKIDYLDPRDRHKLILPKVTNTNDTIIGIAPSAVKLGGYIAGAATIISVSDDVFDTMGGGNNEVHNNSIINGNDNTNNMSSTTSRATADHNTSSSDNNQDNDVTNTDSSTTSTDSNDDNSDNSVINQDNNSQQNQTSTPTVVTQPEPIVITQ